MPFCSLPEKMRGYGTATLLKNTHECILQEQRKRDEELGEERVSYERLCRGDEFVPESIKSQLVCRYSTGKHPFLILGILHGQRERERFCDRKKEIFRER